MALFGAARITTAVLNILLIVLSIGVIILTVWARSNDPLAWVVSQDTELPLPQEKEALTTPFTVYFWVGIGIPVFTMVAAAFNIFSAVVPHSICVFLVGTVILTILTGCELAWGIVMITTMEHLSIHAVNDFVTWAYRYSAPDFDNIKNKYNCCGIDIAPCVPQTLPNCTPAVGDLFENVLHTGRYILLAIVIIKFITIACSIAMYCIGSTKGHPTKGKRGVELIGWK